MRPSLKPLDLPDRPIVPADCPVCGAGAWRVALRAVDDYISGEKFDVVRCSHCGLGVTVPMPLDDVIERYYSARYRGDRHAFTDRARVLRRARRLTSRFPPGFKGRVLDIGCGDGHFALSLRDAGWKVSVTEINTVFLNRLRNAGIEAKAPAEALRDGFGHTFDAVTCWHVLEHVLEPATLVQWVRQNVAPGALFQVTVPTFSSWQARLSGRHWLHLDVPRHRYHFNSSTLRRLLMANGFDVAYLTTFAFEYDWFGALQSTLNMMCARRNVLFERMTSQSREWPRSNADGTRTRADIRDIALSCILTPPIGVATLPFCLISWLFGRGATLTMTARPASQSE